MSGFSERLGGLSVAHLCDACLRVGIAIRLDSSLPPLINGQRAQGRVRPVRHHGSVDVFLEALGSSRPGEVLVIDNQGRDDEGCIGDLTALEVQQAGLAGIVIWGRHRDTAILRTIGLPIFSRGACARGPVRLDAREADTFASSRIGDQLATANDWVVADDDGVILIEDSLIGAVTSAAEAVRDVETRQTRLMQEGVSLREQLRFADYVAARESDRDLDFRRHLRGLGAAIEE
jgi:4-hydroxy-4-methyl-2-oxoglutarate aldolase